VIKTLPSNKTGRSLLLGKKLDNQVMLH